MDHGLEWIIPDPGNIWKFDFCILNTIFSYPGNTGNLIFLISHILEILENGCSSFSHVLEMLEIGIH